MFLRKMLLICGLATFIMASSILSAETRFQEKVTWYRLHLGHGWGEKVLQEQDVRMFVAKVVTPRFPEGLTMTSSRGQWHSPEGLVQENTTVVDLQSAEPGADSYVREIAEAYVAEHKNAGVSAFIIKVKNASTALYY